MYVHVLHSLITRFINVTRHSKPRPSISYGNVLLHATHAAHANMQHFLGSFLLFHAHCAAMPYCTIHVWSLALHVPPAKYSDLQTCPASVAPLQSSARRFEARTSSANPHRSRLTVISEALDGKVLAAGLRAASGGKKKTLIAAGGLTPFPSLRSDGGWGPLSVLPPLSRLWSSHRSHSTSSQPCAMPPPPTCSATISLFSLIPAQESTSRGTSSKRCRTHFPCIVHARRQG